MKKHQVEIEKLLLQNEKDVKKKLESTYKQALKDVNAKLKVLNDQIDQLIRENPENETLIRSKIYQKNYQETVKSQIVNNLDILENNAQTIEEYKLKMYEDGYQTAIYNIQKLGVNITTPINQDLLIKALTFDIDNIPLSQRLYENVDEVKRQIIAEVSRGISSGMSYTDIARNIETRLGVSMRKANQLAQNEGARVRLDAVMDNAHAAVDRGADLVKQWDATLDGKTRPAHRELDQQIAELDEPFHCSAGSPMAPKQFGVAAQDINCRCALLTIPRWDTGESTRMDNETKKIIDSMTYAEWEKKFKNGTLPTSTKEIAEETKKAVDTVKKAIQKGTLEELAKKPAKPTYTKFTKGDAVNDYFYNDQSYKEWVDNIKPAEEKALMDYTGSTYTRINSRLWRNRELEPEYKKMVQNIDKAISKYELKDGITVYRGLDARDFLGFDGYDDPQSMIGKTIIQKGYSSTTPLRKVANDFAEKNIREAVLQIDIPPGKGHGAYINEVSGFEDTEYEFLLKRNAEIEIYSINTKADRWVIKGRLK